MGVRLVSLDTIAVQPHTQELMRRASTDEDVFS